MRILFCLALLLGVLRAASLAWVCDDSFISFRYAKNLVEGRGLVYNEGERVEGYSNFAWTLAMAGAMQLGASPVRASQVLGLACYAGLACILFLGRRGAIPWAAIWVLLLEDFHVWATGGLETMSFGLLACAAGLLALHRSPRSEWGTGALLSLLILSRPDGLLLAVPVFLWIGRGGWPGLWRAASPLVATGAVFALWKWSYYGELLPTAFYSKSAWSPYYTQGLLYVVLYFCKNWFVLPLAAVLAVAHRGRGLLAGRNVYFLGTFFLFLAYVVHSAGDFMFARRLIPAVPFLFLVLEDWLGRLPGRGARRTLASLALVAAILPYPLYREGRWRIAGVADERHFYPAEAVETRRMQGEAFGQALRGLPARVVLEGGMCMFGYFSELPYLVEATGLTQYSLARLPLDERGPVGHEKRPDEKWLTDHRIHFIVSQQWPPVPSGGPLALDELRVGGQVRARIWTYAEPIMEPLRGRAGAEFLPIEAVLARGRLQMMQVEESQAWDLYALLERYYFRTAGPGGQQQAAELQRWLQAGRRGG